MCSSPDFDDVKAAAARLRIKAGMLQRTGSFKFRISCSGRTLAVVCSGGNVDADTFSAVLKRHSPF